MGTFTVRVDVAGPVGDKFVSTEALVDTGATHTMLPRKLLRDLRIEPIDRISFQLAGSITLTLASSEFITKMEWACAGAPKGASTARHKVKAVARWAPKRVVKRAGNVMTYHSFRLASSVAGIQHPPADPTRTICFMNFIEIKGFQLEVQRIGNAAARPDLEPLVLLHERCAASGRRSLWTRPPSQPWRGCSWQGRTACCGVTPLTD